jgi:phosphoribosylformylglycinamidine synthase
VAFLDGDDLGSAKAGANRILHARTGEQRKKLFDQLDRFIRAAGSSSGVCNGFQLQVVKLGISRVSTALSPAPDGHAHLQRFRTLRDHGLP